MLYLCEFTWFPGTTRKMVAERIVEQDKAGHNHPERIKAWYQLAGGGAGCLVVDYDDPRELTAFLQPYMDIVAFNVRAVYETHYDDTVASMRQIVAGS